MRQRRIILISSNPSIHLARWAAAASKNFNVEVLDISDGRGAVEFPKSVPVIRLTMTPSRPVCSIFNLCRSIFRCTFFGTVVNVHYVNWFLAAFSLLIPRPTVLSFWGSDALVSFVNAQGIFRTVYKLAIRRARSVTVNSIVVAKTLGPEARKIVRIDWPVDSSCFRPFSPDECAHARKTLGIPKHATVLLSNRAAKPNYRILEIARSFRTNFPRDSGIFLLVHFPPGSDEDYVKNCIEELHGTFCLTSRGDLPLEIRLLQYAAADFYLSFPISDSYPSSLVEAVACGLVPVCANDTPSYDDIAQDFNMVREGVSSFSPACLDLDTAKRDSMKVSNFEVIRRVFTVSSFNQSILELYDLD